MATQSQAIEQGYTVAIMAESDFALAMPLLVKPETKEDMDGRFKAYSLHDECFVNVNGWLFSFS